MEQTTSGAANEVSKRFLDTRRRPLVSVARQRDVKKSLPLGKMKNRSLKQVEYRTAF